MFCTFQVACPIFPYISWKLRWGPKAWRNVAIVPTTSPSARWFLFLFLIVLAFLPIGFKGETMRHADQYISHVPYQPFFCKIWKTSDFQTKFNTPQLCIQLLVLFLGLNITWSLQMADGRIVTEHFRNVDLVPLESSFQTCMFCSSSCNMFTPWNPLALWNFACNRF